jgi:hypothetical protein
MTHTLAEGTLEWPRDSVSCRELAPESKAMCPATINIGRRRAFRWSRDAREMVRMELSRNAAGEPICLNNLVSSLVRESGHPRDACLRFARQMGITQKRKYRAWSEEEHQKLLALLNSNSVAGIAGKLNRSRWAVYAHLRRLRAIGTPGDLCSTGYGAELDPSRIAASACGACAS